MHDMKPQELLKNWLRRNDMTAKDLAEKAGTNHSGIYRYLNGDTDSMRASTALILAKATGYELDVCDLLGIQPRIVYRCPHGCSNNLHECKPGSEPYNMNVPAHGVNTSSLPVVSVHTEKVLRKTKAKSSDELLSALAVLEHWTKSFDKQKARVKLSPKRQRSVTKAIAAGWSLEDLKLSITGHSQNPWRHEEPARNELATLLRPENIEAGLELVQPERPKTQEPDDSWVFAQAESERG